MRPDGDYEATCRDTGEDVTVVQLPDGRFYCPGCEAVWRHAEVIVEETTS